MYRPQTVSRLALRFQSRTEKGRFGLQGRPILSVEEELSVGKWAGVEEGIDVSGTIPESLQSDAERMAELKKRESKYKQG